jgi:hypothetical protein
MIHWKLERDRGEYRIQNGEWRMENEEWRMKE